MDGKLWIWGKGDGGRLGFGHENSMFVPAPNPNLESDVKSIALGGLHSVALDVLGRIFTWSVPVLALCFTLLVLVCIDIELMIRGKYCLFCMNLFSSVYYVVYLGLYSASNRNLEELLSLST